MKTTQPLSCTQKMFQEDLHEDFPKKWSGTDWSVDFWTILLDFFEDECNTCFFFCHQGSPSDSMIHDSFLPQIVLVASWSLSACSSLKSLCHFYNPSSRDLKISLDFSALLSTGSAWIISLVTTNITLKLLFSSLVKKGKRGDYDQILGISPKYLLYRKIFCILALSRLIRPDLRLL